MKYYVFYDSGSCTYGDHECGLKTFDTEGEAINFVIEYEKIRGKDDSSLVIIRGDVIELT